MACRHNLLKRVSFDSFCSFDLFSPAVTTRTADLLASYFMLLLADCMNVCMCTCVCLCLKNILELFTLRKEKKRIFYLRKKKISSNKFNKNQTIFIRINIVLYLFKMSTKIQGN